MPDRPLYLIVGSVVYVAMTYLTYRAMYDAEYLKPYLAVAGGMVFGSVAAMAMILSANEKRGSHALYVGLFAGGFLFNVLALSQYGAVPTEVTAFLLPFFGIGAIGALVASALR